MWREESCAQITIYVSTPFVIQTPSKKTGKRQLPIWVEDFLRWEVGDINNIKFCSFYQNSNCTHKLGRCVKQPAIIVKIALYWLTDFFEKQKRKRVNKWVSVRKTIISTLYRKIKLTIYKINKKLVDFEVSKSSFDCILKLYKEEIVIGTLGKKYLNIKHILWSHCYKIVECK